MTELTAEQKRLVDFACKVCDEKHKAKYGRYAKGCAFQSFDNEYCPYVLEALKRVETKPKIKVDVNIYDKEEIHRNCTVQIWENTATGKISIGWYKNKEVNNE